MFERLAGKVLTRLLSKYFVQDNGKEISSASGGNSSSTASRPASSSSSSKGSGTKTQLGVWSGYVSLDNLLLKNEVVNTHLKSKGLPFELLRCSVGRVEITVPWGKLGLRGGGGSGGASSSASSTSSSTSGGDGAVVVVVDSVHVLLTSRYEFDDEAMATERIKKRREALAKSEGYVHPDKQPKGSKSKKRKDNTADAAGLAGFFKSRLKEGIVNDVLDKVQVHVRDVHIRFEDVETDPLNPHACGVTLESIHIQSDEDGGFGLDINVSDQVSSALDASMHAPSSRSLVPTSTSASNLMGGSSRSPSAMMDDAEVVRKLMQLNHLAIYWNELDPTGSAGHGPAEIYIIQHLLGKPNSDLLFGQAMNDCIARRSIAHTPSTPGRMGGIGIGGYYPSSPVPRMSPMPGSVGASPMPGTPSAAIPTAPTLMHTYLLQPMDGTLEASLSKTPHDLRRGPALSATLSIDSLAYELRDFQYSRILGLGAAIKYHKFAGKYRLRRPKMSVHENPRAWWAYAIGVIQEELKKSRTRWSFKRFRSLCSIRKQYCDLYERHCWMMRSQQESKGKKSRALNRRSSRTKSEKANEDSGAGNGSNANTAATFLVPLANDEVEMLQRIHDGIEGDLNIDEILFLRALVHARMADRPEYAAVADASTDHSEKGSQFIRGMIQDDLNAEEEYERLLAYLDESSEAAQQRLRFIDPAADEHRISVSLQVNMKCGSLSVFTRQNTSFGNLALASSDQRCFAEFTFCDLLVGYSLLGNYKSMEVDFLLDSLDGSEIRSNGTRHVLLSQVAQASPLGAGDIPLLAPPNLGETAAPMRAGFLTPKRSGSNQFSSTRANSTPLVSCRLAWKPPRAPHFDLSVAVSIEELEIVMSPRCEWPLKAHGIVSHKADSPDAKKFWENINLAYINKLDSAKAGVQAKAAMAFSDHKNMDINIAVDCPIIKIGNEDGSHIIVDLGNAYLSTEKLAGVARAHLNGGVLKSEHLLDPPTKQGEVQQSDATAVSNGSSERNNSVGKTPDFMPSLSNATAHSPARSIGNFSLGASAMSHNISRKRSRGEIFSIAGKLRPVSELGDASRSTGIDLLHTCFYDSFLLRLGSITVTMSKQASSMSPIIKAGFSFVLEKSVIGGDHTIPKLKVNCIADELAVSISTSSLTCVGMVLGDWRSAPVPSYDSPPTTLNESHYDVQRYGMSIGDLIGSTKVSSQPAEEDGDLLSEGSDDSDDMEFLDALDTEEVAQPQDDVSVWFEENWNTDAESLATRSMFGSSSKFRTPRGRLPSISDVSDVSKSTRRSRPSTAPARGFKQRSTNAQIYLNAENLARLDEGGIEENESEGDNADSDDDSFHSAISLGGLRQLVDELNKDILKAETEIEDQKNAVHEAVETYREKYLDGTLSSKDKRRHRQLKEEMKVELQRCEAELKALRATYEDARAEYDSAANVAHSKGETDEVNTKLNRSERSLSTDGGPNAESVGSIADGRGELLVRAKSLLEARAQRASLKAAKQETQHNLTKWLNRDILFGAFSAPKLTVEIILEDESTQQKILEFCVIGINASLSKRSFDTRVFAAVEGVSASADLSAPEDLLFLNGGVKPDDPRALASQYSHLVSSTFVQEDFLRVGIEMRKRTDKTTGALKESLRCKAAIGVTEVCLPNSKTLGQWLDFAKQTEKCLAGGEGGEAVSGPGPSLTSASETGPLVDKLHQKVVGKAAGPDHQGSRSIDVVVQADGITVRLADPMHRIDAAFCLAGVGVRMARQSLNSNCRAQVDLRLNNAQLLDISSGQELLGRDDIYRPLLNARFRTQLVSMSNIGGWVVEEDSTAAQLDEDGLNAWNCHLGIKFHSINALVALPQLFAIKDCASNLLKDAKGGSPNRGEAQQENIDKQESPSNAHEGAEAIADNISIPLRWRADLAVKKASAILPVSNHSTSPIEVYGERDGFCLSFASSVSVQLSDVEKEALAVSLNIDEINVQRKFDDWDLLEPMKLSVVLNIPSHICPRKLMSFSVTKNSQASVQLPESSPWLNQRFDTGDLAAMPSSAILNCQAIRVAVKLSEIRSNLSAIACSEIVHALGGLKKSKPPNRSPEKVSEMSLAERKSRKVPPIQMRVSSPSLDVTMHDEISIAGGASHKNVLSVLSLRGIVVDASRDRNQGASLELHLDDASLFDLTTYPGVCVLGMISRKGGKTMKGGYEITVQLSPSSDAAPASLSLELSLGNYQLLVLPAFFKSTHDFLSALKEEMKKSKQAKPVGDTSSRGNESFHKKSLPLGIQRLKVMVKASGFELLLSSRDIPSYINSRASDPISVVSFRWKALLSAELTLCSKTSDLVAAIEQGQNSASMSLLPKKERDGMIQSLLALSCESTLFPDEEHSGEGPADTKGHADTLPRLVASASISLEWSVDSFQALRTSMRPLTPHELNARGFDSSVCCFVVQPPTAGEQQILSPFDLKMEHILAATVMKEEENASSNAKSQTNEGVVLNISHATKLDVNFVDILLYIKQSTGGINEAIGTSLRPIVDHVKSQKERKLNSQSQGRNAFSPSEATALVAYSASQSGSSSMSSSALISQAIKGAVGTMSITVKGVRVTVVPGGATRLTENPIIKMAVAKLCVGIGITPVVQRESAVHAFLEPDLANIEIGCWYQCELSAHYHNKKLVAWEPLLEPWTIEGQLGCDITRVSKKDPLLLSSGNFGSAASAQPASAFSSFLHTRRFSSLISTLQSVSSYATPSSGGDEATDAEEGIILSSSSASHALLLFSGENIVLSALMPERKAGGTSFGYSYTRYYAKDWLSLYGAPQQPKRTEIQPTQQRPCFSLQVRDHGPMNVNLTGAFISDAIGLLSAELKSSSVKQAAAPHIIRNESGMQIRFREMLDAERIERGERSSAITMDQGEEMPLFLKRNISQSCDPHQAYIALEVGPSGNIDSTGSTIDGWNKLMKRQYKAMGRVPVDSVGVYTLTLHLAAPDKANLSETNIGGGGDDPTIIVRVALHGGIKVVAVESPVALCNTTGRALYCEVMAPKSGGRLIHAEIPPTDISSASKLSLPLVFPVPAHLIPFIDDGRLSLTVSCAEDAHGMSRISSLLSIPERFSKRSANRGIIRLSEMSLLATDSYRRIQLNINSASLRIGSLPEEYVKTVAGSNEAEFDSSFIPEQRLVLFRPPIVITNHLPTAIRVQVRIKDREQASLQKSLSWINLRGGKPASNSFISNAANDAWEDLGIVCCGEATNWLGARGSDRVEMRVKLLMDNARGGEFSRDFPEWSSPIVIPQESYASASSDLISNRKMVVIDAGGTKLFLSVALEAKLNESQNASPPKDGTRTFAKAMGTAPRSLAIFVPLWIVDSTGENLEYATSYSHVAGQAHPDLAAHKQSKSSGHLSIPVSGSGEPSTEHGLAHLLQDDEFAHLEGRSQFGIFMVGEDKPKKLSVRRQVMKERSVGKSIDFSSVSSVWSNQIGLRARDNKKQDIFVRPPRRLPWMNSKQKAEQRQDPLALSSRILAAPERLGGRFGTRLLHVVNRYYLINCLDQDVEVVTKRSQSPVSVRADNDPLPFHFYDSSTVRIRPKGFGWLWSSPFPLRRGNQAETFVRVRNKLSGRMIIIQVEMREASKSPGVFIEIRPASHPPFRIENHTTTPIQFYQPLFDEGDGPEIIPLVPVESIDTIVVLPYHCASYAWDRPDEVGRSIRVEIADFSVLGIVPIENVCLGQFYLDDLVPGSRQLWCQEKVFSIEVLADGPTRVLRISDASLPTIATTQDAARSSSRNYSIEVNLSFGVGISVIDWTPKELIYLRMSNIGIHRGLIGSIEHVNLQIGSITADNQLWVTPYPDLLTVGNRFNRDSRKARDRPALRIMLRRDTSQNESGGVTMIQSFDLATRQMVVKADGNLVELLVKMLKKAHGQFAQNGQDGGVIGGELSSLDFRDIELSRVLGQNGYLQRSIVPSAAHTSNKEGERPQFVEAVLTAAAASKAEATGDFFHEGRPPSTSATTSPQSQNRGAIPQQGPLMGRQEKQSDALPASDGTSNRKIYIEKTRVSAINTNISWTGKLPLSGVLPSLLTPALTFEGLPLVLRPFSSSHTYGTTKELIRHVKGHYVSVYRVIDVLVGIALKPTFVVRAYAYTWQQFIAACFDSVSLVSSSVGDIFAYLTPGRGIVDPFAAVWGDGIDSYALEEVKRSGIVYGLYSTVFGGVAGMLESAFRGIASLNSEISDSLRYDGASRLSEEANSGRIRPPRLFAHEEGNDLLVDYVDGENAGRALLSRVRMGAYLGEGYIYYGEGAIIIEGGDLNQLKDAASQPMIYLMTAQRLLLLKGGSANLNFCTDIWGVSFERTVQVHVSRAGTDDKEGSHCILDIMYFEKESEELAEKRNQRSKYISEHVGLGRLHCTSIQLPAGGGKKLIKEITRLTDVQCFGDFADNEPADD